MKKDGQRAINRFFALKSIFKAKIFVISFQRTGTTSTGKFFKDHNFRVASYPVSKKNDWTLNWFKGDFGKIFNSIDFKTHQVFEDDPWWCGDFYKILFHRFPNSKFVLLERDADSWFNSMISHSNGRTLGNTYRHSKLYSRELDFYELNIQSQNLYSNEIDNLLELKETHRAHYKKIYLLRVREILEFFEQFGKSRLVYARLEDEEKWQKIGDFFNLNVKDGYNIHANKSTK